MNTLDLLNAIRAGDSRKSNEAFETLVAERIETKIGDLRQSIAKNMFAPVVEESLDFESMDDALVENIINEVLTKNMPAGKWIEDFINSENPKFAGKSKEERKKMALGAYYAKQKESVENLDEKDEGKPGLNFEKIARKAAKEYGSKEAGKRVAGAVRKKILAKE